MLKESHFSIVLPVFTANPHTYLPKLLQICKVAKCQVQHWLPVCNIQGCFMSFFLGLKTGTIWGWREASSVKSTFFCFVLFFRPRTEFRVHTCWTDIILLPYTSSSVYPPSLLICYHGSISYHWPFTRFIICDFAITHSI